MAKAAEASWGADLDRLSVGPGDDRPPIDSDGDGKPDVVTPARDHNSPSYTIERGDGTLEIFIDDGENIGFTAYPQSLGDLDGDGKDDFWLEPYHQEVIYLVPGSTQLGRHDVADVAVLFDRAPGEAFEVPVPRSDGDDALVARHSVRNDIGSSYERVLVSGKALLAPGPGGRLDDLPGPLRRFPMDGDQRLVAFAVLRTGAAVPILAVRRGSDVDVILEDDPPRRFHFEHYRDEASARKVTAALAVMAVRQAGRRVLLASISHYVFDPHRYAGWDLDRPCDPVRLP